MDIGGLQKTSLIDFPGKIAAVVFTNGCCFRCHFCYNPGLVLLPCQNRISEEDFFSFLEKRRKVLEGVVVTGGEPTIHTDLLEFIQKIHDYGFAIKLDSCGYFPDRLKRILSSGLVDYVAMDIKAPLDKYASLVGVNFDTDRIVKSINIIIQSGVAHEFRTTLIEGIHQPDDIIDMAYLLKGADVYYFQKFISAPHLVNPSFQTKSAPKTETLEKLAQECTRFVKKCVVRP